MKKLSIVVPVYNAGEKLRYCLDSIMAQTYMNLQIILLDDGSTDDSLTICREYAALDDRVIVLHHVNHGVSFSRNRGIDVADGDYIMFWDSDDYVLLDMAQRYLEVAEESRADIVIGGIRFCERSGNCYDVMPEHSGLMEQKEFLNCVCACKSGIFGYVPNKMYRLALLKDHNIRFREDMAAQEDLEFALSVYGVAKSVFLFSYCGYLYDYAPSGRVVPVEDLVGNQQKLLRLAERVETSEETCALIVKKIQGMMFTHLYHSKTLEEISDLAKIPALIEDIEKQPVKYCESRLVLQWFVAGKHERIIKYFRFRNCLRKFLGKN